jgi:hypothetical protein
MKNFTLLAAAALLIGVAPTAFAQTAPATTVVDPATETRRAVDADEIDRPAAPAKVVVPTQPGLPQTVPQTQAPIDTPTPPIEGEIVQDPPIETPQPPQFFGESVSGKFVWCLDRSGSMSIADSGSGPIEGSDGSIISSPNRILIVKTECIKVLQQLSEEDKFAIVTFGGNPDHTWYADMKDATASNKTDAINFVNAMVASGWTPAFHALELSCQYDIDLNKLFFLCDGEPNAGGAASAILAAFPNWFQRYTDCTLVCVHIGTSGGAAAFMQALAAGNNGVYIHK